jgi:hypothetical protein
LPEAHPTRHLFIDPFHSKFFISQFPRRFPMRRYTSTVYIIAAIALILFIGLLGVVPLSFRWLGIIAVLLGLLALIGREVTGHEEEVRLRSGRTETRFIPGRFDGVLIDARNKITLSRLQLILWTVVVLSAWATFALHRVIPVLQGQLLASDVQPVEQVAVLVAGGEAVGEAHVGRAAAILEQITGADVALPAEDGAGEETTAALYDALAIDLPQEVWLALGISITSLAGAGIIKTNQAANEDGRAREVAANRAENARDRANESRSSLESMQTDLEILESQNARESAGGLPQSEADLAASRKRLDKAESELKAARMTATRAEKRAEELEAAQDDAIGELHAHASLADARWSDMMRGDTVANFQFADLGKIQMFLFTVILVFTYAALIWSLMRMPLAAQVLQIAPSMQLPAFSDSLVLILALSHGGYLTTKATV